MTGKLFIVSTPIGNLEDISFRAIQTLKLSDFILCEDTRKSGILLSHYDIKKPLLSYHSYNENKEIPNIIEKLKRGNVCSLITDGGTPGISDPGLKLIRECIANEIEVTPIPGANAIITSLIVSGFEIKRFYFEGFLPQKKGRQTKIKQISERKEMSIFYESPFRIKKLIQELNAFCPARRIALCREMTKKFEEIIRGTVSELNNKLNLVKDKGEFTVILDALD